MPFDPNASSLGKNKKAANWRAARAAGVKPGTRTIQADGTLGGGTPVTKPVRQPPVKPPKPGGSVGDKPLNTGPANEPLNDINGAPGRPRDPGNMPGQRPPYSPPRPGRPIGGPGGPIRNPVGIEPPQDPGMTLPVQPPGAERGVKAQKQSRKNNLETQDNRAPRLDIMPWEPDYPGGAIPPPGSPPYYGKPGGGVPAPPQFPGSGGIYAGGGMDQPVGSPYETPGFVPGFGQGPGQVGPDGKPVYGPHTPDLPPGFGGGGPMPFNDGRDIGVDNTGGGMISIGAGGPFDPNATPPWGMMNNGASGNTMSGNAMQQMPDGSFRGVGAGYGIPNPDDPYGQLNQNPYGDPSQLRGGGTAPNIFERAGIRLPPRFNGNAGKAEEWMSQNPQSRLATQMRDWNSQQPITAYGAGGPMMGSNPFMGPGGVAGMGGGGSQGFGGANNPFGGPGRPVNGGGGPVGGPVQAPQGGGQEQMQQILAMLMQGRR